MNNLPVIVLLEGCSGNNESIKTWLDGSRFDTRKVDDIFQMIEEITDFTVAVPPQVLIMEIDNFFDGDLAQISEVVRSSSGIADLPIFAVTPQRKFADGNFHGVDIDQLKNKLNRLLPNRRKAAATRQTI